MVVSILVCSVAVVAAWFIPESGDADKVQGYTKNDDGQIVTGVLVHLYHQSSGTHWYQDSGQDGHYSIRVGDKTGWFRIEGSKTPSYLPKAQSFYREDGYDGIVIDVTVWKDSDQDGVSDKGPSGETFNEQYRGTNPNDPNTDDDAYNDYFDPNPLQRTISGGQTVQRYDGGPDSYSVYAEVWLVFNSQSKIVGYHDLKQTCTFLDENTYCGCLFDVDEEMFWHEDLVSVGDGETIYAGSDVHLLSGTGACVTHIHLDKSFSGKNGISFISDNDGDVDRCCDLGGGWMHWYDESNNYQIGHTSNPTG